MTPEYKELLLKDLSARLLYGVKVLHDDEVGVLDSIITSAKRSNVILGITLHDDYVMCEIENIKPLLRRLSDMNDEEENEYNLMSNYYNSPTNGSIFVDWLNKKHFDFRGLLDKKLAITVTEENNPY